MRYAALLSLLLPFSIVADSVTYTYTATASNTTTCGGYLPDCAPLEFDIPQFDPSLGTIDSINWQFSDDQGYGINIVDWGLEFAPEIPLSWQTTEGDSSAQLGMDVSVTQNQSCICRGDWWLPSENSLLASGAIGDLTPYIGTGTIAIFVDPWTSQTDAGGESAGIYTSVLDDYDDATLTVSYVDAPLVESPEPRWTAALLVFVIGLIWRVLRRNRALLSGALL